MNVSHLTSDLLTIKYSSCTPKSIIYRVIWSFMQIWPLVTFIWPWSRGHRSNLTYDFNWSYPTSYASTIQCYCIFSIYNELLHILWKNNLKWHWVIKVIRKNGNKLCFGKYSSKAFHPCMVPIIMNCMIVYLCLWNALRKWSDCQRFGLIEIMGVGVCIFT